MHHAPWPRLFGQVAFSPKVDRLGRRRHGLRIARAGDAAVAAALAIARETLVIASDAVVEALRDRNPDIFRIVVDQSGRTIATIAYLPLTAEGAAALVEGRFDGLSPDPATIAAADETPEAIYIWLVVAPATLARALPAIGEAFQALVPGGCAIFSRAVTGHSARLSAAMGFQRARDIFPAAPGWLLVALPERPLGVPESAGRIDIAVVRDFGDMAKILAVRSATYLAEQFCLYSEEFDGNDFCATQFLGSIDGDPAGCTRVRWFGDFAKLERLAVRKEYRKSKLAFRLVRAALDHCRRKGFTRVYGHSRADLLPFWKTFGFRPIEGRPRFAFANVDYREIVVDLVPSDDAIVFGVDPMVSIRPEGAWDRPGPLDLSNETAASDRLALLRSHTRMIRPA